MLARPSNRPYICAQCLLKLQRHTQRRRLATVSDTHVAPPPSGAARLSNRRLISLHGPEAPKFLQGLITNNVAPPTPQQGGFYAAFLTAPGKVLHDAFLYPTLGSNWHKDVNKDAEAGYIVEADSEQVEALSKHLKKHKLRSKLKMRILEDGELEAWSVWREDERWTAHTKGASEDGGLGMVDCKAPGMGQRLLLPSSSQFSSLPAELEVAEAPLSAYMLRRYIRGVPEGQQEIPRDDSLPMNYNMDIMGAIDFKKGCYLGQELTIRTHHTGVVRRRVLPVSLYAHGSTAPTTLEYDAEASESMPGVLDGQEIRRDDKRKRATGKLIARAGNIGLAMCRLEQMTDLTVSGEGSSFSPDDTFTVGDQDGQGVVGVKAFVPDWMRGRIREPKVQRRVG